MLYLVAVQAVLINFSGSGQVSQALHLRSWVPLHAETSYSELVQGVQLVQTRFVVPEHAVVSYSSLPHTKHAVHSVSVVPEQDLV